MQYSVTANASSTTKLIARSLFPIYLGKGVAYVRFSSTSASDVVGRIYFSRLLSYIDFYFRFPQFLSASCALYRSAPFSLSLTFSSLSSSLSFSLSHSSFCLYLSICPCSSVSNIYNFIAA